MCFKCLQLDGLRDNCTPVTSSPPRRGHSSFLLPHHSRVCLCVCARTRTRMPRTRDASAGVRHTSRGPSRVSRSRSSCSRVTSVPESLSLSRTDVGFCQTLFLHHEIIAGPLSVVLRGRHVTVPDLCAPAALAPGGASGARGVCCSV